MIFYLFVNLATATLMAMGIMVQLNVLFERLGDIYKMEDYQRKRIIDAPDADKGVRIGNAAF